MIEFVSSKDEIKQNPAYSFAKKRLFNLLRSRFFIACYKHLKKISKPFSYLSVQNTNLRNYLKLLKK